MMCFTVGDRSHSFTITNRHAANNAVCVFFIEPFLAELTQQLQLPQADYFENFRAAHAKLASTNKSVDAQVSTTGSSNISSVVNVSGIFYVGHADGSLQCFQTFSSGMTMSVRRTSTRFLTSGHMAMAVSPLSASMTR